MSVRDAQKERSIDGVNHQGTGIAVAVVLVVAALACSAPDRTGAGAVFRLQPTEAAHAKSRVVDIGADARPSWVTPAGMALTLEAEVPKNAELRFACAVDPESAQPVVFRVWAGATGAERRQLWEWTFDPTHPTGRAWHEAAIPLGSSTGRAVRLQLEMLSPANSADTLTAAWAGPRLVAPVSGEPRANIVLVVIDTLRADHVSLYGYERPTTPGIDLWARRRGVAFSNVVAQAPWTLPSHVSMFTGLDTLSHGLNHKEPVPETIATLAELLGDAGYVTKAITGGAYLGPGSGLMQGFDSVEHWSAGDTAREQRANDIVHNTERALRWMAECDEHPFFLFFHTYEVHAPYRAREPFFSRFRAAEAYPEDLKASVSLVPPEPASGFQEHFRFTRIFRRPDGTPGYRAVGDSDLAIVRDLYDAGVAFADAHVTRLLERLAESGLEDSTAVIITSDHGESLGEEGLAGHSSLAPVELLVPLVVSLPDGERGGTTVDTQVRLVDVAPTVLELASIAVPPGLDGRSLLPLVKGEPTAFPDEAWSYAASSNYGVSLWLADRARLTLNDSALPPLHGQEEHEVLGGRGQPGAEREQMRQRARSALNSRLGGLRVRLHSRGPQPLLCTLRGRLVKPNRVKAVELPLDSVRWTDGALELTAEAGQSITVSLQGRVLGRLTIRGRVGGAVLDHALELERLEGSWQAELVGSRWSTSPAGNGGGRTSIRVWIHGGLRGDRTSPADFDQQTLEQLRQLGYVQ